MSDKESRPRNSEATKAAILDAARHAFAANSYDTVGLREIARAADVNVSLVIRYYGSKERLFAVCLGDAAFDALLRDVPRERLARVLTRLTVMAGRPGLLAAALAEEHGREAADHDIDAAVLAACERVSRILMSSINSRAAMPLIRERLEADVLDHLVERIGGTHAREKARLALALMVGVALVHGVLDDGSPPSGAAHGDGKPPQLRLTEDLMRAIIEQLPGA